MSGWRWDVADEGYFIEPQAFTKPEAWWNPGDIFYIELASERAAEEYWSNCDGWEDAWPVTFHIYPPDSEEFTAIEVHMEMEPSFIAITPRPVVAASGEAS